MGIELKQIVDTIDEINSSFEEFKAENNKKQSDVSAESQEKLTKISDHIDDVEEKLEKMQAENARASTPDGDPKRLKHSNAFYDGFIRKGVDDGLEDMAIQANLSVGTDADGGYTIPEELDRDILKLADEMAPMRQYATVRSIGGATYKKIVQAGGTASGWVGETAARPETGTPTFSILTPTMGEIYANPSATQNMLDDAFFDVEAFLREEMAEEFMDQENVAFVTGNGTNKPIGLLAGTMSYLADATRTFGEIQKVKTGVAAALPSGSAAYDLILSLQDELKEAHGANAVFMTHRRTKTTLRKIKDGDGNYMWQQGTHAGQPTTLFGTPVVTNSNFPVEAAAALILAYGDISKAYLIVDRIGTRVLRDPYTNKPFVHFYATKRVGSMLMDTEAVKLLECAV